MQQSVGSSTPQPPPLELLAHEWGQPNIESESELAKLKASIVEEAARSCDQKVIGAKYSATSILNLSSLLMEYLLDMISHELIFIFIQSHIWIGTVHPVFLSDRSYKKLNKSLSQCCTAPNPHTHTTKGKGYIHLHILSSYVHLHPIY